MEPDDELDELFAGDSTGVTSTERSTCLVSGSAIPKAGDSSDIATNDGDLIVSMQSKVHSVQVW